MHGTLNTVFTSSAFFTSGTFPVLATHFDRLRWSIEGGSAGEGLFSQTKLTYVREIRSVALGIV